MSTEGTPDGEGAAGAQEGGGGTRGAVVGDGGESAVGGEGPSGAAGNPPLDARGGAGGSDGQQVNGSAGSAGAAGSSSAGSAGSSSAGSAGASPTGAAGSAGSGSVDPRCPTSLLVPFPTAGSQPVACGEDGLRCDLQLACNSGPQVLTITCQGETWDAWDGPRGCDLPYDYCPGTTGANGPEPSVYCRDGQWDVESRALLTAFGGTCPSEAPEVGSPCYVVGGTGGGDDREPCGYFCPDASEKWTVFACDNPGGDAPLNEGLMGFWTSDGACN